MNRRFTYAFSCLAAVSMLTLAACGSDNEDGDSSNAAPIKEVTCPDGSLTAAGSTAQKNAVDTWIKAYQQTCSESKINYQSVGSGAGIQQFADKSVDFAGSDSTLKPAEQVKADARCVGSKAIHLPMVTGPVAVVYNLKDVKNLQLKPATVAKIFSGAITRWDAAEIKADNPGQSLPALPIRAVHRSDSSGTTDNFTKYLTAAAPGAWAFGSDKQWKAPGGEGAPKSDGVTASVTKNEGAISYVELSFAKNANLSMAKVGTPDGKFVELTDETASKTISSAKLGGSGNDIKLTINYANPGADAYPIVLVTYEIVCEKSADSAKAKLVKDFLTYTSSDHGQRKLSELGFAPLPTNILGKVRESVKALS